MDVDASDTYSLLQVMASSLQGILLAYINNNGLPILYCIITPDSRDYTIDFPLVILNLYLFSLFAEDSTLV